MNGGEWIQRLREELHLSRVAVERFTRDAAGRNNNQRYRIGRGRLTEIEAGNTVPDIVEVEILCECYKVSYEAVLRAFDIGKEKFQNIPQLLKEPEAKAKKWSFAQANRPFSPTAQSKISFDSTRLVSETAEELGVPAAVRQSLEAGFFRLGIIALDDDTMHDLIPGGSVVVIDKSHNTVQMGEWKTIQERPIYFVWHEQGYSCTWCSLVSDTLLTVPHPTSRQPVKMFKVPRAATIIGRVVHVWPPMMLPKSAA